MQYSTKTLLLVVTVAAMAAWQCATFGLAGAASGSMTLVASAVLLTYDTKIELRLVLIGTVEAALAGAVECAHGWSWTAAGFLAAGGGVGIRGGSGMGRVGSSGGAL